MSNYIDRLIGYNQKNFYGDYNLDGATIKEAELGQGAFGRVYAVYRDIHDNKGTTRLSYAMKIIPLDYDTYRQAMSSAPGSKRDLAREQRWIDRQLGNVQNEVRIMRKLRGEPNIAFFIWENYRNWRENDLNCCDVLILMERLVTLKQYMEKNLPGRERDYLTLVLKIWLHMTSALMICDKREILHLDIKPDNIFYAPGPDYFKLSDFGVSIEGKTFEKGVVRRGTVDYMSPEMDKKEGGDNRTDMYSLAVVIYEIFNNHRLPFQVEDGREARAQARHVRLEERKSVPPLSRIPRDVNDVLLKCLEVNPEKRYPDVASLHKAVEALYDKYTNPPKPSPWLLIIGGGAAVAVIVMIILLMMMRRRGPARIVALDFDKDCWYNADSLPEKLQLRGEQDQPIEAFLNREANSMLLEQNDGLSSLNLKDLKLESGRNLLELRYTAAELQDETVTLQVLYDPDMPEIRVDPAEIDDLTRSIVVQLNDVSLCTLTLMADGEEVPINSVRRGNDRFEVSWGEEDQQRLADAKHILLNVRDAAGNIGERDIRFKHLIQLTLENPRFNLLENGGFIVGVVRVQADREIKADEVSFEINGITARKATKWINAENGSYEFEIPVPEDIKLTTGDTVSVSVGGMHMLGTDANVSVELPQPILKPDRKSIQPGEALTGRVLLSNVGNREIALTLYIDGAGASAGEFTEAGTTPEGEVVYTYSYSDTSQFQTDIEETIKVGLTIETGLVSGTVFSDEQKIRVVKPDSSEDKNNRQGAERGEIIIVNAEDIEGKYYSRDNLSPLSIQADANEFLEVRYNDKLLITFEAESDRLTYDIDADSLVEGQNSISLQYEKEPKSTKSLSFFFDSMKPHFSMMPQTINEKTESMRFELKGEDAACQLRINVDGETLLTVDEVIPDKPLNMTIPPEVRKAMLSARRAAVEMLDRSGNTASLRVNVEHLPILTLEMPEAIATRDSDVVIKGRAIPDAVSDIDSAVLRFTIDEIPVEVLEWQKRGDGYNFALDFPADMVKEDGKAHIISLDGEGIQRSEMVVRTVTPRLSLKLDQSTLLQGETATISGVVTTDEEMLTLDDFEVHINGKAINGEDIEAGEHGYHFSTELKKVRAGTQYEVSVAMKNVLAELPEPLTVNVVNYAPIALADAAGWSGQKWLNEQTDGAPISGTGEAEKNLKVLVNGTQRDTIEIDASGTFEYTLNPDYLNQGENTITLGYADGEGDQVKAVFWYDTQDPEIIDVIPAVIDQNTDRVEIQVEDIDDSCEVTLSFGGEDSISARAEKGKVVFDNLKIRKLYNGFKLTAADRTGHRSKAVPVQMQWSLDEIGVTMEDEALLVRALPNATLSVENRKTSKSITVTADEEGIIRLMNSGGKVGQANSSYALALENGKNELVFSYSAYDGVKIDSDITTPIDVDYDNQAPEVRLDTKSIMAGITEITGKVLNEDKGWMALLLSNGEQISSAASENGNGFTLSVPEGTDIEHLSVIVTDASGNVSETDVEYVQLSKITAKVAKDRIFTGGKVHIDGTSEPGATVLVEVKGIQKVSPEGIAIWSIKVDAAGKFALDIPASRLNQGDNAIAIYYDVQASNYTEAAVAGTGTEIVVRYDTSKPKVTVTPTIINRDTESIEVKVVEELYGWNVTLMEDSEELYSKNNASKIPIESKWKLKEERNDRNKIELVVTDAAGNQSRVALQYKDSSEKQDAYAFSESEALGVVRQGGSLALKGVYIVCNNEDMPDYVKLIVDNTFCKFEYTEVDFDEVVHGLGQGFSNDANAAYAIDSIHLDNGIESGEYRLQATVEKTYGIVGPFDMGIVKVEKADTSAFKSSFTRANATQSGLIPDAPSQNSFRANNVVLTGSIDTGVNVWDVFGYFGLQTADGASIIQYKGNTVSTDDLKVHARDGRDDGGFVLSLDLASAGRTLPNGIYTLRFYTKDEETEKYTEILTANIMIDDSAAVIDPESEGLRKGWNPKPTPLPTAETIG